MPIILEEIKPIKKPTITLEPVTKPKITLEPVSDIRPTTEAKFTGAFPFDPLSFFGGPIAKTATTSLVKSYKGFPQYIKSKWRSGIFPIMRGSVGREAMWGRAPDEEALASAREISTKHQEMVAEIKEPTWKQPVKKIAGEAAELLPFMLEATKEGLKFGGVTGGGFAGITALAGQAGPQVMLPEEAITVPAAFAAGMGIGTTYGVVKYSMDVEGGNLYLDLREKGISPDLAQPLAIAGGLGIGLIEVSQLRMLGKPFQRAFSKTLRSPVAQKALRNAIVRYFKGSGAEVGEEIAQEMVQLATETLAGAIEKKEAIPTREEWSTRLTQVAKKATPGMFGLMLPGAAVEAVVSIKPPVEEAPKFVGKPVVIPKPIEIVPPAVKEVVKKPVVEAKPAPPAPEKFPEKFISEPKPTLEIFKKIGYTISEGESNYYEIPTTERKTLSAPKRKGLISNSPLKVKYKRQGYLKFPQEKISSPADVAYAFRELKNEAVERFYVVGVKKNVPISVEPVSIGTINATTVSPFESLHLLLSKKADSYYLIHNHPSGEISISEEDIDLTNKYKKSYQSQKLEFKGHIIINRIDYGLLTPKGNFTVSPQLEYAPEKKVPKYSKYIEWTGKVGERTQFTDTDAVVSFIKGLNIDWKNNVGVIYADTRNKVLSTEILPHRRINSPNLAKTAISLRAPSIFLVNSKLEPQQIENLRKELALYPVYLYDAIEFKNKDTLVSMKGEGLIREPEEKYRPAKPTPPIKPPKQPPTAIAGTPEEKNFEELADYFARAEAKEADVAPRLSEEDIEAKQAEFRAMQGEVKSALFEAIKDLGKIKPYAKGYLKEELSVVPVSLRTRKAEAKTADEMAQALSAYGFYFESDMDLITTIEDEVTIAEKAKIEYKEAKAYLKAWSKRIRARTKADEKLIRSIGRLLSKGTLKGPKVKRQIRLVTGQIKVGKLIREDIALERMLKRAEQLTKEAYRAGRKETAEKMKAHIAEIKAKAKEREALRKEMKKMISDIDELPTKDLPLDYKDKIKEIKEPFDLKKRISRTLARRDSMREFVERAKEEGEDINIPQEKLDMLEKVTLNGMTIDELREVHETVMRLHHQGKLANKLLTTQKARAFNEVVEEGVNAITEGKGLEEKNAFLEAMKRDHPDWKDKPIEAFARYIYKNLAIEVAINMLDTFEPKGINTQVIWDTLFEANEAKKEEAGRTLKILQNIHKNINIAKTMHRRFKVGQYKMTINNAMDIYAKSFNDASRVDLYASGLTDEDIAAVESFLPDEHKQAIQKMFKYYDEDQYLAVDKVYIELEGTHMPKEDYYYQIQKLEDVHSKEIEAEIMRRNYLRKPGVAKSFTKSRTRALKAFREFSYFDNIFRNWRQVEHYKAFAKAVRDANKYLNNPKIRQAIKQLKAGDALHGILNKWLKDMAYGGDKRAMSPIDEVMRFLRTNFVTSVMGFNLISASKAPSSFFAGAEMVGNKYAVIDALAKFIANPIDTMKFTESKSTLIKYRRMRQEREFREITERKGIVAKLGQFQLVPEMREIFLSFYTGLDKCTVTVIWLAAYNDAMRSGKVEGQKIEPVNLEQEAIRWGDKVIRRSQPMGELIHLPDVFRGPEFQKAYTLFKNFLSKNFNRIYETSYKLHKGKISKAKWANVMIWWVLVPAFYIGLVNRKRLPTKEEYLLHDVPSQAFGGLFLLGDIIESIGSGLVGGYKRGLGTLTPAPFHVYEDIETAFTGKLPATRWRHALRVALITTGIPSVQVERLLKGQPLGKVKKRPKEKERIQPRFIGRVPEFESRFKPRFKSRFKPQFESRFTGGF